MKKPLISIILPTYNRAAFLKKAIESVIKQTYSNLQLIVVDDCSEDNTRDVIRQFQDSRIEYYKLDMNRNICYALNYGLKKVRGEYIARLDSDDEFEINKLEKQMDFLQKNPEYKICFTKVSIMDENNRNINELEAEFFGLFEVTNRSQSEWLKRFFFYDNCFAHDAVLMEKSIIDDVGGYNMCYVQLQDFDLWVRIAKKYPIYILEEPLIKIRRFLNSPNENISAKNRAMERRSGNEFVFIRRHFFDDMPEELFVQAFREYFRNSDAKTKDELECEKAFLYDIRNPELALEKLEKLFNEERTLGILEKQYKYFLKDFYEMNSNVIMNSENQRREAEEFLRVNDKLTNDNSQYQKQLTAIYASNSWKLSAPIRLIGKILKGR